MSLAEFHTWLFKAGTGWLGWPPDVVLATPIPQLEMAFEGRVDMLRSIFGGEAKKEKAPVGAKLKAAMALRGTTKVKREQQ